jgi:hypothetical protein
MGEQVRAGNLDSWVERHGHGPEVLIIVELGDPVEAWQLQLDGLSDRYRLTAHYTRGVGRTRIPEEPAHGARRGRGRRRAAGGARDPSRPRGPPGPGQCYGQELALGNPELVCSPAAGGSQPRVQGGRLKGRVVRRGNPSGSRGSELAGWGPKPGERCWPVRALL